MMTLDIKVEVIHKETIKPSSPTPHRLKILNLSVFDQLSADIHVPLLFFYPSNSSLIPTQTSNILKKSLSETLTHFYPFAGQFQYNHSICCNDLGAAFLEAQVNCPISTIMDKPEDFGMLTKQLLPPQHMGSSTRLGGTGHLLLVQVNFFQCGGLAIGVSTSHKVADACTFNTFINTWAAIALGSVTGSDDHDHVVTLPNKEIFGAPASLFPALDFLNTPIPVVEYAKEKCRTRRFVFGAPEIAALKSKAASPTVRNPSRIEVVSGLVWKCAMEASRSNQGVTKPSIWCQAVNMRDIVRRPALAEKNLMGNVYGLCITKTQSQSDLQSLVAKLREGIKEFKVKYADGISGKDAFEIFNQYGTLINKGDIDNYSCSSLSRFGLYEADFGWGKPAWVFSKSLEIKNVIVLVDTRDGDGVEASLTFKEEDMVIIENNKELLAYATPLQHKVSPKAKL